MDKEKRAELKGKLDQLWGWAKAGKNSTNYIMAIENVDDFSKNVLDLFDQYAEVVKNEERQETIYEIMRGEHGHDEVSIVKSLQEGLK